MALTKNKSRILDPDRPAITPIEQQGVKNIDNRVNSRTITPGASSVNAFLYKTGKTSDIKVPDPTKAWDRPSGVNPVQSIYSEMNRLEGMPGATTQTPSVATTGQSQTTTQTPTVPTAKNPVVEEVPAKPNTSNVDYTAVDNLDTQGLYRFIDNIQVRASSGEQITQQEQLQMREAQRKIQQSLNPATTTNNYETQITEQQKQKEAEAIRLKAIEDANISAEEKRLNALYAQRSSQAQDAGARSSQAAARSTSFSGFGRSTFNADQQVQIQDAVNQNLSMLDAEKSLAIERYRAEQAGATAEQLGAYDDRINQLRDKSTQFQLQQAEQINAFNQQNAATYEEKINNLLAYASNWTDPKAPLTEQELATAKAYGQIAIDKDGNVNTALLKEIDPKIMGEVIRSAAEARGAIPKDNFDFMNLGSGLVAKTDRSTGKVEWYQGDVKLTPLEVAKINEINAGIGKTNADTAKTMSGLQPSGAPSTNATQLISRWEGFRDKAYQDSAGVWTVGFGFTNLNGRPVQPGDTIDRASGEKLLQQEISQRQNFMNYITVPLNENQKAALASFEYNLGSGIWDKNAKPILDKVNQGDLTGAASLMKQYINAGGKPIPGLVNRRNEEAQLLQSTQGGASGSDPISKYNSLESGDKTRVDKVVSSFESDPMIKKFNQQLEAKRYINGFNTSTSNPADDQSLIYAFAKMMDPDSVVREGEYATVQKYNQTWLSNFGFNAARVVDNAQLLTKPARENMIKTMNSRYTSGEQGYKNFKSEKTKQIDKILGGGGESLLIDYTGDINGGGAAPQQQPNIPAGLANPGAVQGGSIDNPLGLDL